MPAYGTAAVMLPRLARTSGVALLTAAFVVGAPLLVLLAQDQLAAGMVVIERSAALVLKHGTPYLGAPHLSSWIAYNPYLPAMALFGLPSAAGVQGAPGAPQVWLVLGTVIVLGGAFRASVPHPVTKCEACRGDVVRYTAFAAASPVLALNLAVTTTDTPVLALILLSLALVTRPARLAGLTGPSGLPSLVGPSGPVGLTGLTGPSGLDGLAGCPGRIVASAVALGLACAMKPTAWPAVLVIAAMLRTRDGTKAALTFTGSAIGVAVAVMLPAIIAAPGAMVDNAVLFPLGLTQHLTPADSLTPGDLLARAGPAGHALAVALLIAAGVAVAASLVWRPPLSARAAAWRLAIGLTLMFALGPAERFGYFIYPLGLVGWLFLTKSRGRPTPEVGVGG